MTTVSVCATACFLSASQPVSNAAATACPLSVARRSRSPGGAASSRRASERVSRARPRAATVRSVCHPLPSPSSSAWLRSCQRSDPRLPSSGLLARRAGTRLPLELSFSDSPEPSAARQPAVPERPRRLVDSPSLVSGLHRCVQCGKWDDRKLGELCRASSLRKDTSKFFRRLRPPHPSTPRLRSQPSGSSTPSKGRRAHLELHSG